MVNFLDQSIFQDREEAGKLLSINLKKYEKGAVVYALPRGGVVVAKEIAKALNCPLDLCLVQKIGHPFNPEYAIGAVSESGMVYLNEEEALLIDKNWLKKEIAEKKKEIERRSEVYLRKRPRPSVQGKTAIIVDDGVATGYSMFSAIGEVGKKEPEKLVAAIPVAPADTAQKIKEMVDELVCLRIDEYFLGGVGSYYMKFEQVSDEEVTNILKEFDEQGS